MKLKQLYNKSLTIKKTIDNYRPEDISSLINGLPDILKTMVTQKIKDVIMGDSGYENRRIYLFQPDFTNLKNITKMSIKNIKAIQDFLQSLENNLNSINGVCEISFFKKGKNIQTEKDVLDILNGLFSIDYILAKVSQSVNTNEMIDPCFYFKLTKMHGEILELHLETLSKHIEKYTIGDNGGIIFDKSSTPFKFDYKSKYMEFVDNVVDNNSIHQFITTWYDIRDNFYIILAQHTIDFWPALAEYIDDQYVLCHPFYTPSVHFYVANNINTTDEGTKIINNLLIDLYGK